MKKTINRIILPALLVSGWMLASPAYHASAATMQESAEAQQVRNISGRIVDEKGSRYMEPPYRTSRPGQVRLPIRTEGSPS